MKILAVCGSGLGSSFMLSLSIQDVLEEMGVKGVEVSHTDIFSLSDVATDYIVCGRDIAMTLGEGREDIICVDSILSKVELKEKLMKLFPEA